MPVKGVLGKKDRSWRGYIRNNQKLCLEAQGLQTHSVELLSQLQHMVHVDVHRQVVVWDGLLGLHQPLGDDLQSTTTTAVIQGPLFKMHATIMWWISNIKDLSSSVLTCVGRFSHGRCIMCEHAFLFVLSWTWMDYHVIKVFTWQYIEWWSSYPSVLMALCSVEWNQSVYDSS